MLSSNWITSIGRIEDLAHSLITRFLSCLCSTTNLAKLGEVTSLGSFDALLVLPAHLAPSLRSRSACLISASTCLENLRRFTRRCGCFAFKRLRASWKSWMEYLTPSADLEVMLPPSSTWGCTLASCPQLSMLPSVCLWMPARHEHTFRMVCPCIPHSCRLCSNSA